MTSKDPSRESPISFRPGKLRAAIKRRAGHQTEGQVVRRDLARYYLLLGRVSLDERLTRREAAWLMQASFNQDVDETFSGDPFLPEFRDPSDELLRIVNNRIHKETIHGNDPSEVGLRTASKIGSMTALERAALMDALEMVPASYEEELHDPGNWALIGIRLAEEPPPDPAEGSEAEKGGDDG
jgi:hypothetical protein